jgi:hypothetical protein
MSEAQRLRRLLREVEKIAETWDAPDGASTPYEADAADLLTGLVQEWRRFSNEKESATK